MTERADIIDGFIADSAWAAWERRPLAGDASARRYERLVNGQHSVIVMDAPPETGLSTQPFADMTRFLRDTGLCPPEILAHDADRGIMVLSDLGKNDFAQWLTMHPHENTTLYRAAVDVLIKVEREIWPSGLIKMTPEVGANMVEITCEFYAGHPLPDLITAVRKALEAHATDANTLALRDFHAENLIWRPDQTGINRVGLLDYQDAFVAPSGYDLVSLLRDVRRDIDPKFANDMTAYYIENANAGPDFRAQLAILGVQRNLRILGVFARLSVEAGKKRYIDLIPRVWKNLMHDLDHPTLKKELAQVVNDTLPVPNASTLARLRA